MLNINKRYLVKSIIIFWLLWFTLNSFTFWLENNQKDIKSKNINLKLEKYLNNNLLMNLYIYYNYNLLNKKLKKYHIKKINWLNEEELKKKIYLIWYEKYLDLIKKITIKDILNNKKNKLENNNYKIKHFLFDLTSATYLLKLWKDLRNINNLTIKNILFNWYKYKYWLDYIKIKFIYDLYWLNKTYNYCINDYLINLKKSNNFCKLLVDWYFFNNINKIYPWIYNFNNTEYKKIFDNWLYKNNKFKEIYKNNLLTTNRLLYSNKYNKDFVITSNFGPRHFENFKTLTYHYWVDVATSKNKLYVNINLNNYDECYLWYDKGWFWNFITCYKWNLFFIIWHLKTTKYLNNLHKIYKNKKLNTKNKEQEKEYLKWILAVKIWVWYYVNNWRLIRSESNRIENIWNIIKSNYLPFSLYKLDKNKTPYLLLEYWTTWRSTWKHIHYGIWYYNWNIWIFNFNKIWYYVF